MAIDALTRTADGDLVSPTTVEDWRDWVSATATRNYILKDPLLDWLDLYGAQNGFRRDRESPGYDPRTDFLQFLFQKGSAFEDAVVEYLRTLTSVVGIAARPEDSRDLGKAEETFEAMARGEPVIHHGVLRDADARTYGVPDLLVRSDELRRLFPDVLTGDESSVSAPDVGGTSWHYRVVDIKFTTLGLLSGGQLDNAQSSPAYKAQLLVYNRALGRLQGYLPPEGFLLGRGWRQTLKGHTTRGASCMERLGPVILNDSVSSGQTLMDVTAAAQSWVRRVRNEGGDWSVLPEPSIDELRPNMANDLDGPWHTSKQLIAQKLQELTLLWQVGIEGRKGAVEAGICRWTDPACAPQEVGVTGPQQAPRLQAILDVNRSQGGSPVQPDHVREAEEIWRPERPLEFYVDFETVEDLDDDFSLIPEKGGQPLIFMVGCGHIEDGKWQFECFTVDRLTEASEVEIIDAWFAHMEAVRRRLNSEGDAPLLFHWSPHEPTLLETQYNSAKVRHPGRDWPTPRWFDFLSQVMRPQPVVVRGSLDFGLKAIANAMHRHGLIETVWQDGPADGLGAMVGAWNCAREADERGCTLGETELMQEIVQYNEVDCKVMMEIIRYLRACH